MKRWVLLSFNVLIICVTCLTLYRATRNYSGYCSSTGLRLSDEEKIELAIKQVIRKTSPGGELFIEVSGRAVSTGHRYNYDALPYKNVDEFMSVNKNCCRVVEDWPEIGASPGLYARITGEFSGFVRIDFLRQKVKGDGSVMREKNRNYVALTNCGRVWSGL